MSMQKASEFGGLPAPDATKRLESFRFDYHEDTREKGSEEPRPIHRLWFWLKKYTNSSCKTQMSEETGDLTAAEQKVVLNAMRKAMYEVLAAREENKGSKLV